MPEIFLDITRTLNKFKFQIKSLWIDQVKKKEVEWKKKNTTLPLTVYFLPQWMMACETIKLLFRSVVVIAFYSEIYQNNLFFYFLKIIFDISTSKWFKNIKKILF